MSRELMLRDGTPVEDHIEAYGLLVKREDFACLPPGPPFSKTRGVYTHVASRPERHVGVLDTRHSQGGWAVARACQLLGKRCTVFYPGFKADDFQPKHPQIAARDLGAELRMLAAGRSAILYHRARKELAEIDDAYMMPNALKLAESVAETRMEVARNADVFKVNCMLVPASSATIAAGVLAGLGEVGWRGTVIVHLGYSRSHDQVRRYIASYTPIEARGIEVLIVDEGYSYADTARPGPTPPWSCNEFYDLKTFRWWIRAGRETYGEACLWNIG